MIAIPAQTNDASHPVASTFGKAAYIAMASDNGIIEKFMENSYQNGKDLATVLNLQHVKQIATTDMGFTPFIILDQSDVQVFQLPEKDLSVQEAASAMAEGRLTEVTQENIQSLFPSARADESECDDSYYF